MLNEPQDFLGAMLAKMLTRVLTTVDEIEDVRRWKMTVMVYTDFYNLSMRFENGVSITTDPIENSTLTARTSFHSLLQIINGRASLFSSYLKGDVKISGLLRHPISVLRFYRLMKRMLKG